MLVEDRISANAASIALPALLPQAARLPVSAPFIEQTDGRAAMARFCWGLLLALALAVRGRQYFFNASYWYDEAYLILTIREHGYAALLGSRGRVSRRHEVSGLQVLLFEPAPSK